MPQQSPPADHGFNVPFIKRHLPDWTQHLAPSHIDSLVRVLDPAGEFARTFAPLYAQAPEELRLALYNSQVQSSRSSQALAKTLKDFKGITEFAKPLLASAISKQFGQSPNVTTTMLYHLRAPNRADEQTLLQAALRNFEADEPFDEVALQETSALAPAGSMKNELYDHREIYPFSSTRYKISDKLSIKPAEFAKLCRQLDLGQKYQDHLSAVFDTPATSATVREQTITANKDRLRLQAHIARMKADLSESAYATLLAVLGASPNPQIDGRTVAYSELTVLGSPLSDVLIIGPVSRKPTTTLEDIADAFLPTPIWGMAVDRNARIIVCIPGDPHNPVKEFSSLDAFAKDFAIRLRSRTYQRFISGLVPQDESPRFFRRLKTQLKTHRWNPNPVWPGPPYNPEAYLNGMYEEVWNDAVNLALSETFIDTEVFGARYDAHLARVKSNAKLLAIPTAAVDHQAWIERLEHLAEWGLNVLNVAAFFVPGLGEVMLAVTAVQLGREVFQGVEAWKEGDAEEAWSHFGSVMQNVAFMAVLGAVASKAPPITASRLVDGMRTVTTPFGEPRLWSPDLAAYKSGVVLDGVRPNALGQYEVAGKTYIKIEGDAYEKTYDPVLKQWRIQHPSNAEAYQPVLQHNQLGAWRHVHERPLEWDRLKLLRRMGPQMDGFADAQLQQIADASGVSDDALRQMHLDHQPPPPRLAETIRAFKTERQVDELIVGIRNGRRLGGGSELLAPMVIDLPNWPLDEVLEVFNGAEHWGPSQRFSSPQAQHSVRPTIKISESEIRAGKLPQRVVSALDEPQRNQLLGGRSVANGADPVQIFRDLLADRALARKQSLFDHLLATSRPAQTANIQRLQRSFPSLSSEAAQQVLDQSSDAELARLRSTGKMSLRQAKAIRPHLQQGTLSRALCGLRLESMASAASDRLAVHNLQYLPGWTADLRVEVRLGSPLGPLLDSVGSDNATTVFHLVKREGAFQMFDAKGGALNSIPAHGRNLFGSLLEALPPATRAGFQGSPGQALQEALASYANSHREEMSQVLKQRPLNASGPSLRLPSGQLGYLASGRGVGFPDASLVARVRDLYPNLSDAQASQFVVGRLSAGDSHQQVFNLLANRQREFDELERQLADWIGTQPGMSARALLADRVRQCWRRGIHRGLEPTFELDLRSSATLPELHADFSHVRTVRVNSHQLVGDSADAMLHNFTGISKLDIAIQEHDMPALARKLRELTSIIELSLNSASQAYSPEMLAAMEAMPQLESLVLQGNTDSMDFSRLNNLRFLRLAGTPARWPNGVLQLPRLEALDLQGVAIEALPDELYNAHESLWRGLRLDWGSLEAGQMRKAFNYVHDNPAHLINESQMVDNYCRARLGTLIPDDYSFATNALAKLGEEGKSGATLLDQVDSMLRRSNELNVELNAWANRTVRVEGEEMPVHHRELFAERIRECARNSLQTRYSSPQAVAGPSSWRAPQVSTVLDMAGFGPLGDLPELGDTIFEHIQRLNLSGGRLSSVQVNDFLRGFPKLRTLELNSNRLSTLPPRIAGLEHLTALDLSANELTITPSGQSVLNQLTSLQTLNLAFNRVGALDVTALTNLQSIYLGHTQLLRWPEGVLTLTRLRRLALNHSAVTDVPLAALNGHDRLLEVTTLQGCRLSPLGLEAVRGYADRTASQSPMGITREHLAQGRTGGDPAFFPAEVSQRPNLLLPLDLEPVGAAGSSTSAARLQRIDPQLGDAEAVERIDAWLAQGMGAIEIETRLVQWEQQRTQLIRRLNEWIDVPATRFRRSWVNALDRRRAADQLLESWRASLLEVPADEAAPAASRLDFSGLVIGDIPAMPFNFDHVLELKLSGVALSDNSDGFLRSFPKLRNLSLNQNLMGVLPEAVTQLQELTHLDISFNDIRSSEPLQRQLRSLPLLQVLDLGENRLWDFDATGLDQLQRLDLRGNSLRDWPTGVLEAPALTTLDLANNQISTIPEQALQPEHATLMAGTNLFDNLLDPDELIRLQDYLHTTGRGLGFTAGDIDHLLEGFRGESSDSSDEPMRPAGFNAGGADMHPDIESPAVQKERWFVGVAADSEKHAVWSTVMAQDNHQHLAYILSQLQHTRDFMMDRPGLTQRVWRVLESANSDESLSQRLMSLAEAMRDRATCGDGRILLFNALEVEVFEFETLKAITPERKGQELLKLSRRLFRLAQVEEVASTRIELTPGIDPAEVRLAYRIGLAQRLDLPPQPEGMLFAGLAQVSAADLDQAYLRVITRERTAEFAEQVAQHKYWQDFLREKYPSDFARVQQEFNAKREALEDKYTEFGPAYFEEGVALQSDNDIAVRNLLSELTSRELAEQAAVS